MALVGGGTAALAFSEWVATGKRALSRLLERGSFKTRGTERPFIAKYILGFYSGDLERRVRRVLTGTTVVWMIPLWLGIAYALLAYFAFVYFGSELYITLAVVFEVLAFIRPFDVMEFANFARAAARADPAELKEEDEPYLRQAVARLSQGRAFYLALGAALILTAAVDYAMLQAGPQAISAVLPKGFTTTDFHVTFVVASSAVILFASRLWHPIELVYG